MGVTGIGGIFFRAKDGAALSEWYAKHLGVGDGKWGMWEQQAGTTLFTPFKEDADKFPLDKQYMLNFRVEDLDGLKASLSAAGIEVITKDEWDSSGFGKFAQIFDPEGNAIELWEPAPE